MSTVEMQIAMRASKYPKEALTNLHEFIDEKMLEESFYMLNKKSAAGIDGRTWKQYAEHVKGRIPELLSEFKSGNYRAPFIRRVYIPKDNGKAMRPLGLPTIEDKLLATAVNRILTPVYEQVFYPSSFGFRQGKSQHQALEEIYRQVSFKGMRYIIDADMKNYFGSIDHQVLREMLDQKIKDGVIRRMIDKWLKAGILEEEQVRYPDEGTPQGSTVSPVLSNVYLHYVLDEWFTKQIQPLLEKESFLVRFADDYVLGFKSVQDAKRVLKVLPQRLSKYGLTLHPEKTRLIDLDKEREKGEHPQRTFDFLGFTHYIGKSRKGKRILKRKTSSRKMGSALKRMNVWLRENKDKLKLVELIGKVNQKLRGHYSYYGITFNYRGPREYHDKVERLLHKWLNKRGGKKKWTWERVSKLLREWVPLEKPRIYHSFLRAKP
jgi:group II intron reverse transcriptase/maturase